MGLGDNPLGFGSWDKGTWGLGVGLGDNPLGDNLLGFGGWDKGVGFRGGTWLGTTLVRFRDNH